MESVSVGIWSVIPPIIAIVLALITKEVIFSLFIGIISGTIIYTVAIGGGFMTVFTTFTNLMFDKIGGNASMIVFLALLGALVAIMTMAGGSRAYGDWAAKKLTGRRGAAAATGILGCLIFIDDYFNCLTVGTVMRPVTDKYLISREKLSYIIDATAAPVCIIAPISSWAASVVSYFPEDAGMSGIGAFVRAIPMNLYAILTLFMVFWLCLRKRGDFGPMARAERRVQNAGVVTGDPEGADSEIDETKISAKGRVIDLIIPVIALIILSIFAMLFIGGYWDGSGMSLFDAFGNTSAGPALALGSLGAIIFAFAYYMFRKTISFKQFFSGINTGIKTMVPAIVILCFAWSISGVCRDLLCTGDYVAGLVQASSMSVAFIPAIMFVVAALLSFSTGTSWGTFGILIPIILSVCNTVAPELTITALSSILAGSVLGDHCSPISDTTILSSTGANCKHIDHVSTQIPYAFFVGVVCIIGYIVAGFTNSMGYSVSLGITLGVSFVLLIAGLLILASISNRKLDREEINR